MKYFLISAAMLFNMSASFATIQRGGSGGDWCEKCCASYPADPKCCNSSGQIVPSSPAPAPAGAVTKPKVKR